jgi:hypothetical protein
MRNIYFVIGIVHYLPSSICAFVPSSPLQSIISAKSNNGEGHWTSIVNTHGFSESSSALSVSGGAKLAPVVEEPKGDGILETLQIGSYFALWYLFNIGYNIYNKQALNAVAKPWTIATIQMVTGVFYSFLYGY